MLLLFNWWLRRSAGSQLVGLGLGQQLADGLAPVAVRLMLLGAAADPSQVTFSLPGKPGWVLLLQQAARVVARLHALQQVCSCSFGGQPEGGQQHAELEQLEVLSACSAAMEAAWPAVGSAELQLCLAGLQEVPKAVTSSKCSAAVLFKCLIMLEAAATEYTLEPGSSDDAVIRRKMGVLPANWCDQQEQLIMARLLQMGNARQDVAFPSHQELVRCCMHMETLRCFSWCLWLLGVG